ncbi:hypothetical protein M422DRAFT_52491 [Sphaerobolus stellatus SS14]|uniref:Uncharacterized protein n=1 Tax=Sphaerobolus stellatus (strain SS14) TaxID=990650 RepID=A0A0C9UER7_SPHS4|nr:hypothetical protein M422DRAFT_52491 [Sphaerobolus stellatus SS14]
MLSPQIAQLAGLFAETLFYGFYLVSLCFCLRTFPSSTFRTLTISTDKILVLVTLAIAVTVTLDLSLIFLRVIAILRVSTIQWDPSVPESIKEVSRLTALNGPIWQGTVKAACIYVESSLADAVLIWRCWAIYNRSYLVICLPVGLWLACIGISCWGLFTAVNVLTMSKELLDSIIAYWTFTLTLNILVPALIVYRLQRHGQERASVFSDESAMTPLNHVKRIILDSGLLYAITSIPALVTQVINSNALHITSGLGIMVEGITFNLILIRVAILKKEQQIIPMRHLTAIRFASSNTPTASEIPGSVMANSHSGSMKNIPKDSNTEIIETPV